MSRIALVLLAALTLFAADGLAADNPWAKVQAIPNRSELHVWQKGARDPLTATFADASENGIVVVVKNKQMTIAKEDIDRIDSRPPAGKAKPAVTTTEKSNDPDYTPQSHPNNGPALPSTETSGGVSFGSGDKGEFKTVYVRPLAPKK